MKKTFTKEELDKIFIWGYNTPDINKIISDLTDNKTTSIHEILSSDLNLNDKFIILFKSMSKDDAYRILLLSIFSFNLISKYELVDELMKSIETFYSVHEGREIFPSNGYYEEKIYKSFKDVLNSIPSTDETGYFEYRLFRYSLFYSLDATTGSKMRDSIDKIYTETFGIIDENVCNPDFRYLENIIK